jgi:predicted phosphodiesterase
MTKILIQSDTHGKHDLAENLPEADIYIHCGDFMNTGRRWEEITSFNEYLSRVPVPPRRRFISFGNHDIVFDYTHPYFTHELSNHAKTLITKGICVQNEVVEERGVKFYFSPFTPEFCDWGFNMNSGQLRENWAKIPDDTEFLVTHGPPYGILDTAKKGGEHLGDRELLARVKQLNKLKYHAFGHIHGGRGIAPSIWGPTFVNASCLTERYLPYSGDGYILLEI